VYLALALQLLLLALGVRRGILVAPRRKLWVPGVLVLGMGALLLAALFTGGAPWRLPVLLWSRMEQSLAGHDLSNLTRLRSWEAAWRIYLEHPLAGVGWGGFGFWYFRAGLEQAGTAVFGWPVTNSVPLRVLAETGTVGALLWALCLQAPLAPLGRLWRAVGTREVLSAPAFVLATCVAGMLLQMLTFSQLNLPHLWLGLGLSAALARGTGWSR
jgi:O-antigen ligase